MRSARTTAPRWLTTRRALRAPSLRLVVLAFGAASAVEAATWLAIGVYAFQRSGAAAVGIVGLALLLPSAIAAPAASAGWSARPLQVERPGVCGTVRRGGSASG